ncbi:Arm DNA-binding domain-containing protein [Undibacterium arcticum]
MFPSPKKTGCRTCAKVERVQDWRRSRAIFVNRTDRQKKRWRMIYRRLGKGTALSFGTYPEMSLTNARQQCADAHRLIADGIDPIEQKRERRKQTQAARPITRKFHFSMNDQGDMVIEKLLQSIDVDRAASRRAANVFLIAANDETQGD